MPSYSCGRVAPERPSPFICSTIASGNLSSWSNSSALGMISLSTKSRTISTMAFCSSVISWKFVFSCCSVATAIGSSEVVFCGAKDRTRPPAGALPSPRVSQADDTSALLDEVRREVDMDAGTVLEGHEMIDLIEGVLRERAHPDYETVMVPKEPPTLNYAGVDG